MILFSICVSEGRYSTSLFNIRIISATVQNETFVNFFKVAFQHRRLFHRAGAISTFYAPPVINSTSLFYDAHRSDQS